MNKIAENIDTEYITGFYLIRNLYKYKTIFIVHF